MREENPEHLHREGGSQQRTAENEGELRKKEEEGAGRPVIGLGGVVINVGTQAVCDESTGEACEDYVEELFCLLLEIELETLRTPGPH